MMRRFRFSLGHWLGSLLQVELSWLGAFLGLAALGYLGQWLQMRGINLLFMIGSFGATAVLLYGAPSVPYAQPRNLLGGQVLSALVGVAVYQFVPEPLWLASALAVACSMAVMQFTGTFHPPGGATALIVVLGDEQLHALGYWFALMPVGLGALVMLMVALVINNLPRSRRYPLRWF